MTTGPPHHCSHCHATLAVDAARCPRCGRPVSLPRSRAAGAPPERPSGPASLQGLQSGSLPVPPPTGDWPRSGLTITDASRSGVSRSPTSGRAHPPPRTASPAARARPGAGVIAVTLAAVGLIVGLAWWAYPRAASTEASGAGPDSTPVRLGDEPSPAANSEVPAVRLPREPTDLLPLAKTAALAWDRYAVLVELQAEPIVAGGIAKTDASRVTITFGIPSGKLGPGARVDARRLVVSFRNETPETRERAEPGTAVGLADPGCSAREAWRAAVAAGVPSSAAIRLTYAQSERHGRPVWRVEAPDDPKLNRTIDGQRCTILTR